MNKFQRASLLFTLMLCGGLLCHAQEEPDRYQGKIVSVTGGNTLVLSAGDKKLHIHLLGIDVPYQALREASRKNLKKLVDDRPVTFAPVPLELDAGGRKYRAGKLFVNDADVALAQLRDGMAWQTDEYEKYQDPRDRQLYAEAERQAMAEKRGVWGASFTVCKELNVKGVVTQSASPPAGTGRKQKVYGVVHVEVEVENGALVSARASCGHPVLQTKAVRAVYVAKFSTEPQRFAAIITFNFERE